MKRRNYLVIAIFFAFISTGAIFKINQAPTKRSKAPGEQSCGGCHAGNINNGPGSVSLNLPGSYIPGTTYTLTHTLADSGFANFRHGFTTTSLDNSGAQAGAFTLIDPVTTSLQTDLVSGNSRQYLGHRSADSSPNSWDYQWTAPSSAVGEITFYTVSVYANRNNAISGDRVYEEAFTISLSSSYPQPSFDLSVAELCVGDSVSLTNTSSGTITSYQWDFGSDAVPATANTEFPPSVTYTSGGNKTITLVTTGPDGTENFTKDIDIIALPAIDAGLDISVCEGDSVQLFGIISGQETDYTYDWNGPGQISSIDLQNTFITPDSGGLVLFMVSSPAGCGTVVDSLILTYELSPVPTITSSDTLLSSEATSYQWYFTDSVGGNPIIIDGATNQMLVLSDSLLQLPTNQGFVLVEVVYLNGCSNTSTTEQVPILISTIDLQLREGLRIYPNPSNESLFIQREIPFEAGSRISLSDVRGQQIKLISLDRQSGFVELNVADLPTGMYVLKIQQGSSVVFEKIIKD